MSTIRETIEVDVPVRTAYNQWTQFEEFPSFMDRIEQVEQLEDTRLHWVASIGGIKREWFAKIVEQRPDEVIAWQSETGAKNNGRITFEPIGDSRTRITSEIEVDPDGLVESVADTLGFVQRSVAKDLENFKELIERQGVEDGAWRGEVSGGMPQPGTAGPGSPGTNS